MSATGGSGPWAVGDVVAGRYQVLRVAGVGGMGRVLRVRHLQWGVDLAVKSPKPEWFETAEQRGRFVSEAEIWVRLGLHPNVCACHYVRLFDDGVPRVFAEYVPGGSLHDWITDRRLYAGGPQAATALAVDLAIQLAWGLDHAHRREVGDAAREALVHQDVKPANVLIAAHGDGTVTAKVTDFGLARARAVATSPSTGPAAVGARASRGGMTRAYASPEQLNGESLDQRSDVFSFAVSVLEMFTGGVRWPIGPAARDMLAEIRGSGAGDPGLPPVPAGLADLLDRCLLADASARPAAMAEVAAELAEVYRRVTGRTYPRRRPRAADLLADERNNRALSLLDLDRPTEAGTMFDSALTADPKHAEATYNAGLLRWRRGERTDEDVIADLDAVRVDTGESWPARHALGLVHLARGDVTAARPLLEGVERELPGQPDVRTPLADLDSGAVTDARCIGTREIRWCWQRPLWQEPILEVDVSADGRRAVTGGVDDKVRVWDVLTGRCVHTLAGHVREVRSVHICPDGRYAVSTEDRTMRIWDLVDGTCLRTITTEGAMVWAGINARAGIAIGTDNGTDNGTDKGTDGGAVVVWDLRGRQVRHRLDGSVSRFAVCPDGRWLLTAGSRVARLWDLDSGRCHQVLHWEGHSPAALCFDVGTGVAAIGGYREPVIDIWDLRRGGHVRTLTGHARFVQSLALSADGTRLLSGALDGTVRVWDLDSGRCVRTFRGHDDEVRHVQWGADDRYALSAGQDNTVRLWRLPRDHTVPFQLRRPREHRELAWLDEKVAALLGEAARQEAAGDRAAALTSLRAAREIPGYERAPDLVAAWRALGRSAVRTGLRATWPALSVAGGSAMSVDVSPDGRLAASGGGDLSLWDLGTGARIRTIMPNQDGPFSGVDVVQFSADGTRVMASCRDGSVHTWSVATGEALRVLDGERLIATDRSHPVLAMVGPLGRGPRSTRFSADGTRALIGGGDRAFRLWDLERGVCLRTMTGHDGRVQSAWISGDGASAATSAMDHTVRLWDLATGRCRHVLLGHTAPVMAVALSDDGRFVISAGGYEDRTIRVWDAATGASVAVLDHPSGSANAVRFTPDGRYAVSGGEDSAVRVWDIASGRCVRAVEAHRGGVECVAPTSDGYFVLSCGNDGIRLWALDWELCVP
jgi:WD40 repeat protein/serine/threonine protein kinase